MIKLRLHPSEGPPLGPRVLCIVEGDRAGELPLHGVVQLQRLPGDPGEVPVYRVTYASTRILVHEVGDEDAAVRLFERV